MLLALRRIMKYFKKVPCCTLVVVLMLGSLFMQFLPAFIVNYDGSGNQVGNKVDQEVSRPETSASAPFTPSVTFGGSGSDLLVNDSYNGTIKNDALTFQGNQSTTVPIIAPYTGQFPNYVPLANISRVSVKLHPVKVSPVIIPWNTSISRQNLTMNGLKVAQTFYIGNYSVIKNVSICGLQTNVFGIRPNINITIVRGGPTSTTIITKEQWTALNTTSFPQNSNSQWYNFSLPEGFANQSYYSLIISVSYTSPFNLGDLKFCLVNGTRFQGETAYNYTASTVWRPIIDSDNTTALDFSIKVGLQSATDVLLSESSIRARINTGAWENFSKTTHEVTLGQRDGAPWVPTENITNFSPYISYFGVRLILLSNNSMQLNASINITYFKHGYYASTIESFLLSTPNITWNGTYNATLPRWNETSINGTIYTLHVQPSTQIFAITIPARWQAINITRPMVKILGKVPAITVTNASMYTQKIWQFLARSSKMPFKLSVNGTNFSNGNIIHFNGTIITKFSGTYTGNASFWLNATKRYWNNIQSFSGSSFSFTNGFKIPSDTVVPSGYYTCLVIVDNGTDVGINATGIRLIYEAVAYLAGNTKLHDIEGPFGSNTSAQVMLNITYSGDGLANAIANTTWGNSSTAWWSLNVTGKPGDYLFYFNTSSVYVNPGDNKNVTITFTRYDMYPTSLTLTVHIWRNSSLIVQPYSTSIFVNETVPFYINYTDASTFIFKNSTTSTYFGQNSSVHFSYSLGGYSSNVLKFQVQTNWQNWTCVLLVNMTRIPRIRKAGTYTFMLTIQAELGNGTKFQPQSYSKSITAMPLQLSWSITRLDATFNSTLPSLQITEFEGVSTPSTIWVQVCKTVYPNENVPSVVNATGLYVQLDFKDTSIQLMEDSSRHGLYKGVIDLTGMSAPQVMNANITITGNDVGSQQFSIQIHLIKRYVLHGELMNPPDSFTENQFVSLRFKLFYVDKDGVTNVYANKSVKVHLVIYDGSINIPYDSTLTTDINGTILLANISIPKVLSGAKIILQIKVIGDKSIDPNISWTASVPIVQDFWYRNGLTIFLVIIVVAIGLALFVKQGIPRLKLRREETKIAIVKTRQDSKQQGRIKMLDGGAEHEPIDVDVLESSLGFAMMHMMPPEIIDLDLHLKQVKRSRTSRTMADSSKPLSSADQASSVVGDRTDQDDLVKEKTETIKKAIELETHGDVAGAIEYYKKVVDLAKRLAHDDDAFTYGKKIEELKKSSETNITDSLLPDSVLKKGKK